MQCQSILASGRVHLSSLSVREPARDHAYLDIRQAPSPVAHTNVIGQRAWQLASQSTTLRQLQGTDMPTRQHQLLGSFQTPAGTDAADGRLAPTARLDAAWHLAALPEARGAAGVPVGLPPLVPAAVQCFSDNSKAGLLHNGQTIHNFAAAAVAPAPSGRAGSLAADFKLIVGAGDRASGQVSGLVVRPAGSRGAAPEQSSAEGARAGITYCTQWQAVAPEGECLVTAQRKASERSPASAVSLVLTECPAERASAAALATLQSLALLAAPRSSRAEVELVSSERTNSRSPQLGALLRSAALERSSELIASSHTEDLLTLGTKRTGSSRLRLSLMETAASLWARAGPQDTRCAGRLRHAPRLLPVVASALGRHDLAAASHSAAGSWLRGGCHLVTGGLGALGLAAAGWLLASGAPHVRLSSRNVASAKVSTRRALSSLLRHAPVSAVIIISQGDVAAPDELNSARPGFDTPLRGAALDSPAKLTFCTPGNLLLVVVSTGVNCSRKV